VHRGFPEIKPKPLNIGVFKALRLDANQVLLNPISIMDRT